ncbi:Ku protein [Opitutus sp. ER46]|uniref:non-homologous end joining protein Ku n=1 Tax=Opitutus sp. ER46 TaxID=2161864 RepID=UPI000D31018A|nr:Ku protein [Opitutus sp. ER46]PTX92371.1 Ku protein [Opitutus sp. ER46]
MRPIWKGSISFGLVTIPISVFSATSSGEKISFKMLRRRDLSPIRYKRVAEVDGQEVSWDDIVKGYEYEKDKFVVFEEKDFDAVELASTETISIQDFVELDQIDPVFFHTPYYLEPMKGGAGAYALLRDVLTETGKVGIAKVTLRNREHLAAVKPDGSLLVMELMHFANEISPAEAIKVPAEQKLGAREKEMAKVLVNQMSTDWKPERYQDEYAAAVLKLVDQKIKAGGKELPGHKKRPAAATNVVDLVKVLQESLAATGKSAGKTAKAAKSTRKRTAHHHKAA